MMPRFFAMQRLLDIAFLDASTIDEHSRRFAQFSLFDWLVAGRAGMMQDASRIIRDLVASEGGRERASVFGLPQKVPARAAALANGTISHALDYDDTHFAHIGHPSVGIYPAALAAAEAAGVSVDQVRDGFLLGAEASCRLGMVLGRGHYQKGFHQTATAGAFGATIAAGRVHGIDRKQMQTALSLVATRASGLKSQFGSMGKPYNAGIAASNGIEAVELVTRGFTSSDDGIGGTQGFIDTHTEEPGDETAWAIMPPEEFVFDDIKYKLHACCHGTHAMIEALLQLGRNPAIAATTPARIEVTTHPRWLRVCDIKQPRTGLEVKFSYCHLAAMVLSGRDTASDATFSDDLCTDQKLVALAGCVEVLPDDTLSDTACRVRIFWKDGSTSEASRDLAQRMNSDDLEHKLRRKGEMLLGPVMAARLWDLASGNGSAAALGAVIRQDGE